MRKCTGLIFTLILLSLHARTQTTDPVSVRGKIVNKDNIGIPYVNISLRSNPAIGTFSNSEGIFQLYLSEKEGNEALIISCIGYEDVSYPLRSVNKDSVQIQLLDRSYLLQEIVFKNDSAQEFVRQSTSSLVKNLSNQKYVLQGFFREIIRSKNSYDRLTEAAVDVFDKGGTTIKGSDNLNFRIRELRKSEDYMDLDWKAAILNYISPKNGLHGSNSESLFYHDYIRDFSTPFFEIMNAPLNEDFFEFADFHFDSTIISGNNVLVRLKITPKDASKDLLPHGYLYIREKDLSIFQMDYYLRTNKLEVMKSLCVPGEDYLSHTIIKYKEYDGKMYLSMLYRKSFRQQMNFTKFNSNISEGVFYDEKIFITNDIITEKENMTRFKRKERQNKDIDLYSEDWSYNKDFWQSYNAINETPLQPNIKTSLEREVSLDEQFKKNKDN